jgi:UPF0042 nucleotide-binding protein
MQVDESLHNQVQLVVVTGYSGAGKSTVLRALEDIGFFCVDNLPLPLLDSFVRLIADSPINRRRIALGIDVRAGTSVQELTAGLEQLSGCIKDLKIVFLISSIPVLVKRFQETRRKHPLSDTLDIMRAIEHEQNLLQPLIARADLVLDTDLLTINQLRSFIRASFVPGGTQCMMVSLVSFGFKYGVPTQSNFVYDVRSLPNPYFVPSLKMLDGTHPDIQRYLFEHADVQEYWNKLFDFVTYSIKKSYAEGRFFITIAIGCTGGKHRSVAFVQKLAQHTLAQVQFLVEHRDVYRDVYQSPKNIQEEGI